MMKIGLLIKELRIKKGLTQEALAEKTELSARTIQRIENGDVDPRAYSLQMIANALDVEYSLFVEEESDDKQEIQEINNKNWLGLLHLSGLIPLIFPTVLIWNLKKDKVQGIAGHYRAAISFQLMMFGIILGCFWVYWKVNIPTPLIVTLLVNGLFTIMNTLKVVNGEKYLYPIFDKKKRHKTK